MSSGRRRFFTLKNKRHMPKWLAFLAACLVRLWAWTLRVEVVDPHGFLDPKRTAGRIAALLKEKIDAGKTGINAGEGFYKYN